MKGKIHDFFNLIESYSSRNSENAFDLVISLVDGLKIFEIYGVDDASFLKDKVSSEGGVIAWITLLAIAGFSPVPFKLLTITSGFIHFNFFYFVKRFNIFF